MASLEEELLQCQLADRFALQKRLRALHKRERAGKPVHRDLSVISEAIEKSRAIVAQRAKSIPERVNFPDILPITGHVAEISRLLAAHQVLVVAGDTGSGKTTQLPKICLQAGFGRLGQIGHTQPRRLAAVSVANRIAEELQTEPGKGVGFQVRFDDRSDSANYLKLMTDGILLAELQGDPFLNKYEVLIIDEAHERSLNIDFLLGLLKRLLARRPELKLIITSATIDLDKFSRHFHDAPIVQVSGRTYPVTTHYRPLDPGQASANNNDQQLEAIRNAIAEILDMQKTGSAGKGDILVFLSSEREIRETAQYLRKARLGGLEILPLYARLRQAEQMKVFQPHSKQRVVLATNVAETSITVPGINFVVDPGFARISRYSIQHKVQRLPIEAISQASANQRMGRCGRLADGVCLRLYTEQDFAARPAFTDPEIKRTNLAAVILKMLYLRLGEVSEFPFIDPPEPRAINEGFKLLLELNAIDSGNRLTSVGKQMAQMPTDPRLAAMLIAASRRNCLTEMLIIVSALSIQDPRESGNDNRDQARQMQEQFDHPDSDFLSFVELWNQFEQARQTYTQSQLRKYCKTHFLSYMRMREWRELHTQLRVSCKQLGLQLNQSAASYGAVHKALLVGSLNQIACHQEGRYYLGNRHRRFSLFPTSVLSRKKAKWIVTGDLIETENTFAALAAKIQPEWVEEVALHLVKREYFDPHWSARHQCVMAYEKVQLYGLVVIEKSLVAYSELDPDEAHRIFLADGLMENQLKTSAQFYSHNQAFLQDLAREEERLRRPEVIVSTRAVRQFYEQALPGHITSTKQLETWLEQLPEAAANKLIMTEAALVNQETRDEVQRDFPEHAALKHNKLKIDYKFEPGAREDGATIKVPLAVLGQLTQSDVDWAIPGILREKCIALLKGLPKSMRKNFIPVSGFVDQILPGMTNADGDLLDAIVAQIRKERRLQISRDEFSGIELPSYLKTSISVCDEAGRELALGEDLAELQNKLGATIVQSTPEYGHAVEVSGLKDWELDNLPQEITLGEELVLVRFPALVDEQDSVAVRLFVDEHTAQAAMQSGLARLYMFRSEQQVNLIKKLLRRFIKENPLLLPAAPDAFETDALNACYAAAFETGNVQPRTKAGFEENLQAGKSRVVPLAERTLILLKRCLEQRLRIRLQLKRIPASLQYLVQDISLQLDNLFPMRLLMKTPIDQLEQYPRYLQAIECRLEKAPHMGAKDRPDTDTIMHYWQRYENLLDSSKADQTAQLQELRWMLEELRVSLFAQHLGTRSSISPKRVEKLLGKLK